MTLPQYDDHLFDVDDMQRYVNAIDGLSEWLNGAEEQVTRWRNGTALKRLMIIPRSLTRSVSTVDLRTSILNSTIHLSLPVCFAPTAFQAYAHPDGEVATAIACAQTGSAMIISAWTHNRMETIASQSKCENLLANVYIFKRPNRTLELIRRAEQCNCKAIVVSIDIPILSRRRGLAFYNKIEYIEAGNFRRDDEDFSDCISGTADATWDDFAKICTLTALPVIAKGVMNAEDALLALKHGAAAIYVSNHGGRQIDHAPATIEVLWEIVSAVGNRCDVYVDGGFRSGMDVFKALACGAKAVFLGRPAFYGLAYNGREGVVRVLNIIEHQLRNTMAMTGCSQLAHIDSSRIRLASAL